jgi:hypothetical protein
MWVISKHNYLAIATARVNLVAGMMWLRGTSAACFNRMRVTDGGRVTTGVMF